MIPGGFQLQFRSRSILSYYKKSGTSKFRSQARQQSIEQFASYTKNDPDKRTYSGQVTQGSQKRLTRAIENLLQIAKPKFITVNGKEYMWKVNFITLTLYSFGRKIPGHEAHKQCLEPLLRWLRTKGMTGYVWKAELQNKRIDCKQLHYHITTDCFIDKDELRNKWNELQKKAGYLDYFNEKFGHWNPNSTDVHATHNKKNLIGYLKKSMVRYADKSKYKQLRNKYLIVAELAKANQNKETIEGKVWDCSQNIKTSYYEVQAYHDITKNLAEACKKGDMEKKEFERCTVYELKGFAKNCAADYLPAVERFLYYDHLEKMRFHERIKPDINTFSSS